MLSKSGTLSFTLLNKKSNSGVLSVFFFDAGMEMTWFDG